MSLLQPQAEYTMTIDTADLATPPRCDYCHHRILKGQIYRPILHYVYVHTEAIDCEDRDAS